MRNRLYCLVMILVILTLNLNTSLAAEILTPSGQPEVELPAEAEPSYDENAEPPEESELPEAEEETLEENTEQEANSESAAVSAAGEEISVTEILEESPEIVNIIVPTSLDFSIDPLEFSGRGQVYSETFMVENLSDKDILLTFTGINVTFANDTDFELLTQPFDSPEWSLVGSGPKSIYLALDFGRADMPPMVLTGDNGSVSTVLSAQSGEGSEYSRLYLSLSGNLNTYPSVPWASGDVKINLTYQIDIISPAETDTIQILTEEEAENLVQEQELASDIPWQEELEDANLQDEKETGESDVSEQNPLDENTLKKP